MTTTAAPMRVYLSCAATAKLVRKALADAFPGQKFSVRSDTYAGGASIRIGWVDGPAEDAVNKVGRQFEGSTFDPMIDLKSYVERPVDGKLINYGSDHVFATRSLSQPYIERLTAAARAAVAADSDAAPLGFAESTFYPSGVMTDFGYMMTGTGYTLIRFLATHIPPEES